MQRFALIHDGSEQGWQAAYLAYHVAAQLGAPLQVLLIESPADKDSVAQRATQIEVGGRAAGVLLETHIVPDFSIDNVTTNTAAINGLFLPLRLLPEEKSAARLLESLSCPLWIVSEESKTHKMAVLVDDLTEDADLIAYAAMLSHRMSQSLTGLILGDGPSPTAQSGADLAWLPVQDFSLPVIASALNQLYVDLLFIRPSEFSLASGLSCTCVIYPAYADA